METGRSRRRGRLDALLAGLLIAGGCSHETLPSGALDSPTEAARDLPTSPEVLLVRERLTSPPGCAEPLRKGDLPAWDACRERLRARGERWPASALVVIGCFDPAAGAWQDASGCLPLVAPVISAAGGAVRAEVPAPVLCEASGDWAEGAPAHFPPGDESRFAATATSLDSLRLVPPGLGPSPDAGLQSALAAAVERDVGERAPPPGGPLELDQVVAADLDGDGTSDWLVAARLPSVEEIYYRFSGLYLVNGTRPDSPVLLMGSQIERFRVWGTSDLDRDGSREILLESSYYEGSYTYLYRLAGDDLVMLGGWGCGA